MPDTFSNLTYHLVFSTKGRLPLVTRDVRHRLFPYIGGIVRGLGGVALEVGGMPDHVHVVTILPTSLSVADAARTVKANSSRWLNQQDSFSKFGWQRGYGAFSVSKSMVSVVIDYVGNQEHHHRKRSFQDEFSELLRAHGVEFDVERLT